MYYMNMNNKLIMFREFLLIIKYYVYIYNIYINCVYMNYLLSKYCSYTK